MSGKLAHRLILLPLFCSKKGCLPLLGAQASNPSHEPLGEVRYDRLYADLIAPKFSGLPARGNTRERRSDCSEPVARRAHLLRVPARPAPPIAAGLIRVFNDEHAFSIERER